MKPEGCVCNTNVPGIAWVYNVDRAAHEIQRCDACGIYTDAEARALKVEVIS